MFDVTSTSSDNVIVDEHSMDPRTVSGPTRFKGVLEEMDGSSVRGTVERGVGPSGSAR
jgi:hypothetical protein